MFMKIIVVGCTGTIGKAVVNELAARHEVIPLGHEQVDITNPNSIENMYKKIGAFDALVSTTGQVKFIELTKMTEADFLVGLNNKLMGQVNLVTIGLKYIKDKGSFTLTSGVLNQDPIAMGSSAAMVNGAIDGFVTGAAIEMARGIRINVVSPTVVAEAMGAYGDYFRGFDPVPLAKVALAFSKSVEGLQTGQIYRVGY
jgi:NAD(P)-dependent dehydrogenase (short-subunit alcohol dehydrogenase family)